jgi:polysaccharide export outer membrane protein
MLAALALVWAGCRSPEPAIPTAEESQRYTAVGIQPGDRLQITFPGAPGMNVMQQVQSDGTIALPMGGSLQVREKSAPEVEKELLAMYGPQLVLKEVVVSVESAGFPVFVSGAVQRPGRVQCRESITVLEAIVEAGGAIEGRADLRRVKIVRQQENGTTQTYEVNLRDSLKGETGQQFYLRPSDVVYVPERFSFY